MFFWGSRGKNNKFLCYVTLKNGSSGYSNSPVNISIIFNANGSHIRNCSAEKPITSSTTDKYAIDIGGSRGIRLSIVEQLLETEAKKELTKFTFLGFQCVPTKEDISLNNISFERLHSVFKGPVNSKSHHIRVRLTRYKSHDYIYGSTNTKGINFYSEPQKTQTQKNTMLSSIVKKENQSLGKELECTFNGEPIQRPEAAAKGVTSIFNNGVNGSIWISKNCEFYKIQVPNFKNLRIGGIQTLRKEITSNVASATPPNIQTRNFSTKSSQRDIKCKTKLDGNKSRAKDNSKCNSKKKTKRVRINFGSPNKRKIICKMDKEEICEKLKNKKTNDDNQYLQNSTCKSVSPGIEIPLDMKPSDPADIAEQPKWSATGTTLKTRSKTSKKYKKNKCVDGNPCEQKKKKKSADDNECSKADSEKSCKKDKNTNRYKRKLCRSNTKIKHTKRNYSMFEKGDYCAASGPQDIKKQNSPRGSNVRTSVETEFNENVKACLQDHHHHHRVCFNQNNFETLKFNPQKIVLISQLREMVVNEFQNIPFKDLESSCSEMSECKGNESKNIINNTSRDVPTKTKSTVVNYIDLGGTLEMNPIITKIKENIPTLKQENSSSDAVRINTSVKKPSGTLKVQLLDQADSDNLNQDSTVAELPIDSTGNREQEKKRKRKTLFVGWEDLDSILKKLK